ncbi:dihydrodipicolinate synthase family protein [candidate division KSB1 bacterium]|nr:dihydrodipicolinate synthase family protein [candidate division KSB1 bacterium]
MTHQLISHHTFHGLIAAVHTPMYADKRINFGIIETQYLTLAANKIKGAFVCGTTGECMSLTVAERLKTAEKWREVVKNDFKLIIHVGHNCIEDSKTIAAHSESVIAADAISVVGPSYFRPECINDLVLYCREIASAAPRTPFFYYHMPSINGLNFPMIEFIKIASKKIPTFVGLKYTDDDMMDFSQCLAFNGNGKNILFGRDEYLLYALTMGAKSAVGSTYNLAAPLYNQIMTAFESGDVAAAQKHQTAAILLVVTLKKYRLMEAQKAAMKAIGIDCGPCRLPLRSLTENEYQSLYADLRKIGFFSYCSKINQLSNVNSAL